MGDDDATIRALRKGFGALREPKLCVLGVEVHGRVTDRHGIGAEPKEGNRLNQVRLDVQHLVRILRNPRATLQS